MQGREGQAVQSGICIQSWCQKVGMNGLVYFLERQFLREDLGVLFWMMVRDGFERGHLFPRWFQLEIVFATYALQGIKPPVY